MFRFLSALFFLQVLFISCDNPDPNLTSSGQDELKSYEIDKSLSETEANYHEVFYIPIYSDIYFDEFNQKNLLAATLSIRNTSYNDSLFISKIDYFNTEGTLVRSYLNNDISLPPMATVNYVIEKDDDSGGHGANFIVDVSAKNKNIRPIIQAVMIGQHGNKGFSFTTDGISIK